MNWPFLIRATLFGMLFFLYNVASGIVVLGAMPDAFGWLKVAASGVVAFVIGTFTFVRDPEKAWHEGPAVKKILVALLAVGMLAGCGAPQITIPTGQAAVMYANARADYATAKIVATQACVGGKIDKASCDALGALDLRAQALRASVEQALMTTSQPIDWAQVMSYTASVSEMLIKLGLLAVK